MTDYAEIAERIRQMIENAHDESVLTYIYDELKNEGIGWIPVSERLPEDGSYGLAMYNNIVGPAVLINGNWFVHWPGEIDGDPVNATFWQHLPQPPKDAT